MINPKTQRNALCPCGSGKKFKRCCQIQEKHALTSSALTGSDISMMLQIALTQHQAGRLNEAEAMYSRVLQNSPQHPDALHFMGMLASQTGRSKLAVELIQQAIQFAPSAVMHFNLATELYHQGVFDEAEKNFCLAIKLKPDFFEAHYSLGQVLQDMGKHEEAQVHIIQAAQLRPDMPDVYIVMASIYSDLGKFEAAQAELAKALERSPENPIAIAMLPGVRKMMLSDEPWLNTALQQVHTPSLAPAARIKLLFALGKYYDDTHQFDLAFSSYRQANELKRGVEGEFDRGKFTHFINTLINTVSRDKLVQWQAAASNSERPVFIVGMPRSGTSLIEQIIASHPAAFGAGELNFWNERGMAALHSGHLNELSKLAAEYESLLQTLDGLALRVVDKMPSNFMWLGLIKALFPYARIIHAQRNPADTCLSIYFQDFKIKTPYASSLEDLTFYYREYLRLMAHWRAILPPENFLEVPYEALIDAPEKWIRGIIDFVGLDWHEKCLEFHRTDRKVATCSNWSVRQKIYLNAKTRWRNYQSHISPLLGLMSAEELAHRD